MYGGCGLDWFGGLFGQFRSVGGGDLRVRTVRSGPVWTCFRAHALQKLHAAVMPAANPHPKVGIEVSQASRWKRAECFWVWVGKSLHYKRAGQLHVRTPEKKHAPHTHPLEGYLKKRSFCGCVGVWVWVGKSLHYKRAGQLDVRTDRRKNMLHTQIRSRDI